MASSCNAPLNSIGKSTTKLSALGWLKRALLPAVSASSAWAATINLIRKRPTAEGQASITRASDVSGPLTETGNIRGRLVADYKTEGAWIDRYKMESQLLYGISEFDLSEDTLLTLGFSYLRTDVDSPSRTGLPTRFSTGERSNLKRAINNAPTWSYNDHEQTSFFTSLEQQLGNGWSGKIEYSHSENKFDEVFGFLMGDLHPDGSGLSQLPVRFSGTRVRTTSTCTSPVRSACSTASTS